MSAYVMPRTNPSSYTWCKNNIKDYETLRESIGDNTNGYIGNYGVKYMKNWRNYIKEINIIK